MSGIYVDRPDFWFGYEGNIDPNDTAPPVAPVWTDLTKYVRTMSSLQRGRQYELAQTMAAEPSIVLRDVDETLNPDNPTSPLAGEVLPYRRAWMLAQWPNVGPGGATGNLLNPNMWGTLPDVAQTAQTTVDNQITFPIDPTFETYAPNAGSPIWVRQSTFTNYAINVSTTNPRTGTKCLQVVNTNGATQSFQFTVITIPGRTYVASMYVRLDNAGTVQIKGGDTKSTTVNGTSTTTTLSYVRLQVSWTAISPRGFILLQNTTGNTVRVDDMQLEEGSSPSTFTTTGSAIYPVFSNYAERFQRTYLSQGYEGIVTMPCVDLLSAMSATFAPTPIYSRMAANTPDFWWPLADQLGTSTYAPAPSNFATPALVNYASKYGGGTAPLAGVVMAGFGGDNGGTGVEFAVNANTQQGTIIGYGAFPSHSSGFTFPDLSSGTGFSCTAAFWFTATTSAADQQLLLLTPSSLGSQQIGVKILTNTTLTAYYGTPGGTLCSVNANFIFTTGALGFIAVTLTQNSTNTTLTLWVNGFNAGSSTVATSTLGGLQTVAQTSIEIGGNFTTGANFGNMANAVLAHVALWEDVALTSLQVGDIWGAGSGGYAGITSGDHIFRWNVNNNLNVSQRLSSGSSIMSRPSYVGTIDLLTDAQNTATAEYGTIWAGPDGCLAFEGRLDRWLRTTPTWEFGEIELSGEIPYDPSIEFDDDPTFIYANVQITQSLGIVATGGSYPDIQTATRKFFGRTVTALVDLRDAGQTQSLADWIFYTHNAPQTRIAQIVIDPSANSDLWPVALGIEIGDRIRVTKRSPAANGGTGLTVTLDFFVESVTHDQIDMDAGTWTTTILASPVGVSTSSLVAQPWILQDPNLGVLGSTTKLGF